ncbi:MAG: hypothetical protein NC489_40465, partial [Ruminococcus flavefaciens]|nr:hypothetical protein [Ruminococcus flavefaciens]
PLDNHHFFLKPTDNKKLSITYSPPTFSPQFITSFAPLLLFTHPSHQKRYNRTNYPTLHSKGEKP